MNWAGPLILGGLALFVFVTTDRDAVRRELSLDDADRAQEHETTLSDARLLAARHVPRPPRPLASNYCRACGEEIPPARRLAVPGTEHCVDCKIELEARW